jgi:tetratricopeptide (TPR) repeat protein
VNQIDVLYETSALKQKPPFDEMVHRLGEDTKAIDIKVAPLKSLERAFEKTAMKKADDNRFDSDRLLDLVRGMLVFQTMEGVAAALEALENSKELGWTVVRIKNRMRKPTGGGWADVLLNLTKNDDNHKFICELQLVHKKMLVTREELGGHDAYDDFRTAGEFLELVQEKTEAGVAADLERQLAEARKNRDGKKCKELKGLIEKVKALDAEIKRLTAAETAAFDDDDFDEGDRLHGELEARKAELVELTAKAAGGDAVDAPVVEKVSVKAKPSAQTQFDGGWQTSAGTYKIFASGGTITAEGNPQPWYPGTYECWGPAVKATWKHGAVSNGTIATDGTISWTGATSSTWKRSDASAHFSGVNTETSQDSKEAKSPAAWYSEGLALGRNGEKKWPEAIKAFQNCVALDANHSKAWFWLGQSYYLQNGSKNCEASYEPYTRCIALDPKNALAHGNLGSVLQYARKDYDGAERHYRKAIELEPKAYACWNLSLILENQKNDIPGAIKLVEECVRLGRANCEDRLARLRAKL